MAYLVVFSFTMRTVFSFLNWGDLWGY